MDAIDFCTFFALDLVVKKKMDLFYKVNEIDDFKELRNLIIIDYLITKRGRCFDYDLSYILKSKNDKISIRRDKISLGRLKKKGLISYDRSNYSQKLKRSILLTSKGFSVLDNYRAFFSRIENETMYGIKKARTY